MSSIDAGAAPFSLMNGRVFCSSISAAGAADGIAGVVAFDVDTVGELPRRRRLVELERELVVADLDAVAFVDRRAPGDAVAVDLDAVVRGQVLDEDRSRSI